jgi:hypothetical protein
VANTLATFHEGMGSDEFIPWDLQHPELVEGDIMPTGKKSAILNSNRLWPNATIPYVISANFSTFVIFLADERKFILIFNFPDAFSTI